MTDESTSVKYSFLGAIDILKDVGLVESDQTIQSQQLHRWIGERHLKNTGRHPGSGNSFEYTEKDIRRAVAYKRLRRLVGAAVGSRGRDVADGVRELVAYHRSGNVLVTHEDIFWIRDDALIEVVEMYLAAARPVVVVPCSVLGFGDLA
jgi:hypothetical protein